MAESATFKRAIGTFTAQVTLKESGADELTITQHPVEQGSPINDHAYMNPPTLTIYAGWPGGEGSSSDYFKKIYSELLKLQSDRKPFDIVTGKRVYKNMLMKSLQQTTDEKTENVLMVSAQFQHVIIVNTQVSTLPPPAQQASPERTNPPTAGGTKQLAPAPSVNAEQLEAVAAEG